MMVKHFLIDGYNLAHKLGIVITKNNLQQVRDDVCRKVSRYMSQKRSKVTLVFDGRGVLGATEQHHALTIVYTPSGESADARIKKMIDETPAKSSLCVVSSDNEILRYAQVSRAQTMHSEAFLSDLKSISTPEFGKSTKHRSNDSIKTAPAVRENKPSEVSASDIEEWKKLFQ
ncbi:MAG: NYN domain-containing protein [Chloroherpetonaceae bacterium]